MLEVIRFAAPGLASADELVSMYKFDIECDSNTHRALSSALDLAHRVDLDHDPVRIARAINLEFDTARDRIRRPFDFVRDFLFALGLARRCRDLGLARRLNLAVDITVAFAITRGHTRLRPRCRAVYLSVALTFSRYLYLGLCSNCAGNDAERIRTVSAEVERTEQLLFRLTKQVSIPRESSEGSERARISPLAAGVADAAARLLPGAERSRYGEEYRAELREIALTSRRAQWAYSLRLLSCAPKLRYELLREVRGAVQR